MRAAERQDRASYFEAAAHVLERRGDREGGALMRELGRQDPIVPFALTDVAAAAHPTEAGRYRTYRESARRAILGRSFAQGEEWRAHRAEADLHLVAYELEKRNQASMNDVRRGLDDAGWMLRGYQFPEPDSAAVTEREMNTLRDTHLLAPLARLLRSAPLPPRVSLAAIPAEAKPGAAVMLQWRTSGADSVRLDGIAVRSSGSTLVSPDTTRRYQLTAEGSGGRASMSALVTVLPLLAPRVALVASPPQVQEGENVYILWRASDAETVTLNGLRVPSQGTAIEVATVNIAYRLEAVGPGGNAATMATVTVTPKPVPLLSLPPSNTRETQIAPAPQVSVEVKPSDHAISWFSFTGTRPDSATRSTLDRFAALMNEDTALRLHIAAHTDGLGSAASNLRLSQRRARAARDWIANHYEINRDRIAIAGMGESEPLVPENDGSMAAIKAARKINRRIELQLTRP